ncbi:MAG: hypothetical protein WC813_04950 [Patescibacteria group bacterium]|jgi:hypothetical protein
MRRIVLTTSDIMRAHSATLDGLGNYQSTGRLERAIAEGYEVFITTTRTKLVEIDDWWRKLVPDDHIFLANPQGEDLAEHLASGWKKCIAALGLTWPTLGELKPELAERLGSDWSSKPGTWVDVQHWLPSQGVAIKHQLSR